MGVQYIKKFSKNGKGHGLDYSGSAQGQVVLSGECGNKLSCSVKY
jgi:hypothetical protein